MLHLTVPCIVWMDVNNLYQWYGPVVCPKLYCWLIDSERQRPDVVPSSSNDHSLGMLNLASLPLSTALGHSAFELFVTVTNLACICLPSNCNLLWVIWTMVLASVSPPQKLISDKSLTVACFVLCVEPSIVSFIWDSKAEKPASDNHNIPSALLVGAPSIERINKSHQECIRPISMLIWGAAVSRITSKCSSMD